MAKDIKSNPKPFYRYLNSCTKSRSKVGPLRDENGELQTEDQAMTTILNDTFCEVFTVEDIENMPAIEQVYGINSLSNILVEPESVLKKRCWNLDLVQEELTNQEIKEE